MSIEENKAIVRQWAEARNANNLEAGLALWANEWQEPIAAAFNSVTEAFPDVHITLNELVAEGDKVALSWTFTGTHRGTYRSIPATGKTVNWTGIDILTVKDGKLASIVRAADNLSLLQQLGVDTSASFPFTS